MRSRIAQAVAVLFGMLVVSCSTSITVEAPVGGDGEEVAPPDSDDADGATDSESDDIAETPRPAPDPGAPDGTGIDVIGRAEWSDADCEFDEPASVATRCGWLEVPERWDDPDDGDSVRLHVGVFSAGPTDTAPIVYLEGGPGGDPLANISQGFDTFFGDLVDRHDIVIVAQRGTGSSRPHLQCQNTLDLSRDLLDDETDLDDELDAYTESYAECASDLRDDGVDLGAYNSIQNAHDIEALRDALGYEQWNVLGVSYGTRLGQTLMRLHPDGVRAIVLDSVLANDRDPSVDQPVTARRAFETLWDGCAASSACGAAYPDLETRFFALVDALDQDRLSLEAHDVLTGERYPAVLDGDGLMELTFGALYSKAAFAGLPELVGQLERGDTSGAATLLSQNITSEPFIAAGMYWSVTCNEEVPFITDETLAAGLTGDPRYDRLRPDSYVDDYLDGVCGAFDSGTAPPVEDELVASSLPTLVLGGVYDPITPPDDGESLLARLDNAQFVVLPHTGHGAIADPCGQALVLDFLQSPDVSLDTSCIDDIAEPAWVPGDFSGLEFESFSYDEGLFSGSGVRPVGWDDLGAGTFTSTDNLLHTTVLLQQVLPRTPAGLLLSTFGSALGTDFEEAGTVNAGGLAWTRHQGEVPGSIVDVVLAEDDGNTLLVVLQSAPADHAAALEQLLPPVLDALGP